MLATLVDQPFNDKDWIFELKLDGYRAITEKQGRKLLFYSRNGLSLKQKFPAIVSALKKIKQDMILDGEIVVLNENNKPDFQRLQQYNPASHLPLAYYVFDLLSLENRDLKAMPLTERKKILKTLIKKNTIVRYNDHIEMQGKDFYKTVRQEDLEGLVAKKKDSHYKPGCRTGEWLKIKNHKSQDVIIAGYTHPRGTREQVKALLLGQYKRKKLVYTGLVDAGLTGTLLAGLFACMKPLVRVESPFDHPVKSNHPVTWLEPILVCEVSYSEITMDGIMKNTVYKGLRPDKNSDSVTAEKNIPVKQVVESQKNDHEK
jgi:bifunctional non-homologous end joining protein LigD